MILLLTFSPCSLPAADGSQILWQTLKYSPDPVLHTIGGADTAGYSYGWQVCPPLSGELLLPHNTPAPYPAASVPGRERLPAPVDGVSAGPGHHPHDFPSGPRDNRRHLGDFLQKQQLLPPPPEGAPLPSPLPAVLPKFRING